MHPVPELIPELVLYDGGIWIRPRTYDRQIVKESRSYLRLAPDANDVLLDIGANIGAASWRFLNAGVRQVIAVEPEPVNFSILTASCGSTRDATRACTRWYRRTDGARSVYGQ
jgi:hypothetical protein